MASTHPLSAFFLFRELSECDLRTVAAQLEKPVTYRRGDCVYTTHTFRRAVGLILSGSVIVRSCGEAAPGVVINHLHAGDLFGVAVLFDTQSDAYVTEITADHDTTVWFIPQETMSQLLQTFPSVAEQYIRFLSGRIRFLNRKVSALTVGNTENRLYHHLLSLQDERGVIRVNGTMTELANTLNMGRSSLYRSLDTLLREGILIKEGNTYRIP